MEGRRRRSTLSDQISTLDDGRGLAGYTLDDVLAYNKRLAPPASASARPVDFRNRTLLDIIRDEEPGAGKGLFGHKDKRTWKSFRDKLRLKRAGSAWVSTVPIPTSDIPVHNKRSLLGKRNQVRFDTVSPRNSGELNRNTMQIEELSKSPTAGDPSAPFNRPRQSSTLNSSNDSIASESTQYHDSSENSPTLDAAPVRIVRPQISRHNSVRVSNAMDNYTDPTEPERDNRIRHISTALSEERTLSAREAVAAQEAADAAAAEAAEEEEDDDDDNDENEESTPGSEASSVSQPIRMSLMDLLQETDREMGFEGSNYGMGDENDDEEYYYDDEEEDDDDDYEDEEEEEEEGRGGELSCCVCRVRHRGAALIPCGHSFCRLCSKELMVGRGNCPTCNGFIWEILHVF